jgi:hypothetical protein
MLATNPLLAYGVDRATRREPLNLVVSERVVVPEDDATTLGFREESTTAAAQKLE